MLGRAESDGQGRWPQNGFWALVSELFEAVKDILAVQRGGDEICISKGSFSPECDVWRVVGLQEPVLSSGVVEASAAHRLEH